jgi:anti-sigma regulatory factor (Ser/Thr protein kinase)
MSEPLGVRLDCGPEAAAAARQAVVAADGSLPLPVREDLLLLVTELVTNAVRHAGAGPEGSVDLTVRMSPGSVRVEVEDAGAGFSHEVAAPQAGDAGGWGLYLVDRIADDWGVVSMGSGTRVWFELSYSV